MTNSTRARTALWLPILGAALALGCPSTSSGPGGPDPDAGDAGGPGRGVIGEDIDRGGLAGRGPEGAIEAQRLGLRTAYFDYDSFDLRSDATDALRHNADVLRSNPSVRVEIQGNCDERGSEEYNLALGERRARAARDYLMRLGVDEGRLMTVSFGENNPAVVGHEERAWSRNRRADFAVLP